MDENRVEPSRVTDYHPGDLVVALPHLNLVSAELTRLSLGVRVLDQDRRLDLALIELENLSQSPEINRLRGRDNSLSSLDILLAKLRGRFAGQFGGWVPQLGKNRVVHSVHGLDAGTDEHVSGGGAGDPRRTDDDPDHPHRARDAHHRRPPAQSVGVPASRAERGGNARVGVLDTHIVAHPRLVGRFIAPHDALLGPAPSSRVYSPWAGHATFVAGLIVEGAPAAELEVRQVLNDARAQASLWAVAKKMVAFTDADIDILNVSFGCYTDDARPPLVITRAVEVLSPSVVIVAAAGNHGNVVPRSPGARLTPRTPIWPAALDNVLAVGAHDGRGGMASFTPRGAPWISLLAPGVDIRGDYLIGRVRVRRTHDGANTGDTEEQDFTGTAVWSGTSFAAAYTSGVIAARTIPGHRSAQEARDELIRLAAGGNAEGIMRYSGVEQAG